jgi:non-heme chloroperoxidase
MDTYADDLSEFIEKLDLREAVLVGFSAGGGEVSRYIGACRSIARASAWCAR